MGVGFSFWEPDDPATKSKLLKWLGLIGDLFIRALKCVVLPLVFINVTISIMEMMTVGKAGSIGIKTVALYLGTTVMASILGIISIVSFKSLFEEGEFEDAVPAQVSLGCNVDGAFLAEMDDGTVVCTADYASDEDKAFKIIDLTSSFSMKSSGPASGISLSDTVRSHLVVTLLVATASIRIGITTHLISP